MQLKEKYIESIKEIETKSALVLECMHIRAYTDRLENRIKELETEITEWNKAARRLELIELDTEDPNFEQQ